MKYILSLVLLVSSYSVLAIDDVAKSNMLGLRTTTYLVTDIDKAKQWYAQAFGIAPYFDEPYYVGFNIGGFELGLMPTDKPITGSSVVSYWGVENIKSTYQTLLELGATALEPVSDVGGGIKLGVVEDPFGNPIGIIYNPLFKAN